MDGRSHSIICSPLGMASSSPTPLCLSDSIPGQPGKPVPERHFNGALDAASGSGANAHIATATVCLLGFNGTFSTNRLYRAITVG